MSTQSELKFAQIMHVVCEYYGQTKTKEVLKIYWSILQFYDVEKIKEAIGSHLADPEDGRFFPKAAHILKKLQFSDKKYIEDAWEVIISHVSGDGRYSRHNYSKDIGQAIQDLGGWGELCRSLRTELPFLFKKFSKSIESSRQISTNVISFDPSNSLKEVKENVGWN